MKIEHDDMIAVAMLMGVLLSWLAVQLDEFGPLWPLVVAAVVVVIFGGRRALG